MKKAAVMVKTGIQGGKLTVYGTPACGWTTKQLDELKSKNIGHTFVDCSKKECPSFVEAYPTIVAEGFMKF